MAYLGRKSATATLTSADIADSTILIQDLADEVGIESTHHKVPAHADDSARDTAIPSPATGMLIYNTNSGAVQQYNGVWSTIAPAPNITAVSGFLNDDSDSTITVFGTNFTASSAVKMFSASSGGSQIGSNATTTFNSNAKLTAVFGAGSIGASGSTAYIEVDNVGATSRFATAITVNADPTVVHAGATGTSANTTTHLGTYGGSTAGGPTDSNTKLLLNFDRGGGTDIEDSSNTGGDGHKITASGHVTIKASPFGDGKSAMKFDGSNDYVKVDKTDIVTNGGLWTLDFWVYYISGDNGVGCMRSVSNAGGWSIYGNMNFDYFRQGGSWGAGPDMGGFTTNQWVHYAVVQNSAGVSTYKQGIFQANDSTKIQNNSTVAWQDLMLGASDAGSPARHSNLYLDEYRISNSDRTADSSDQMYTGSLTGGVFSTPTTRYTVDANTKLLLHSNKSSTTAITTTADANGEHPALVLGDAPEHSLTVSAIAPAMTFPASGKTFGSTGAYFDGTGDWLTIADSDDLDWGTGDFTIDFWVYMPTVPGNYYVCGMYAGGYGGLQFHSAAVYWYTGTGVSVTFAWSSWVANTWHHVALARSGTDLKFFVDGTQRGSTVTSHTHDYSAGSTFYIGTFNETVPFLGYIDNFRISKGIARYTANFTPETALYGANLSQTIPTITFTGTATQLAGDEDIEFTAVENSGKPDDARSLIDIDLGLTLTNLTGADKHKATLTGTLASPASTTYTNMPLKLQVRKTLGDAAYANASRVVTFSGSTVTTGLAPAMPVTGTGIPTATTITSVDTSTTITLSADPTGGTLTGQSLVFEDLTRVSHQYNGSDTINNADAMYTIATGTDDNPVLFNARRYTGTRAIRSITGLGFKPDFVWIKSRSTTSNLNLYDSVRGSTKTLISSGNDAEDSYANTSDTISSFDADGFTLGDDSIGYGTNNDGAGMVAWGWKAGGAPSGSLGTIDSSTPSGAGTIADTGNATNIIQSVNQTTGFSITTLSGHNSGITFPHNLGGTPAFVIGKSTNAAMSWVVWHKDLTALNALRLNTNVAQAETATGFSTAPSSTVITIGTDDTFGGETGKNYVYYAWKAVAGVSAFGSYEGTGGALTVSGLGFTPSFLLIKNIDNADNWMLCDKFRGFGSSGNTDGHELYANWNYAEYASATGITVSNGQFVMNTNNANYNYSGHTYVYAAFA
jgi:hypothetical protein